MAANPPPEAAPPGEHPLDANVQGIVDELRRLQGQNVTLTSVLRENVARLTVIEDRLAAQDLVLPEIMQQSQREALIRQWYERYLP